MSEEKRIAMLLAGSGYLDGSEINEAVMCHLATKLKGARVDFFSLNEDQSSCVNHCNEENHASKRNVLEESARIVRGAVAPIQELKHENYSGLVIPGGFGVAKNFCNFAEKGAQAEINIHVENCIASFISEHKAIMAVCIAPALVGMVAAKQKIPLMMTLGNASNDASKNLKSLGHSIVDCSAGECVSDPRHPIITTPAFMHDISIEEAWLGILKATEKFFQAMG